MQVSNQIPLAIDGNLYLTGSSMTYGYALYIFRSMFYTSLGRLLMVDLGEDEEKFDQFMMPLTQAFETLGRVMMSSNSGYNSEEVRRALG